MDLLGERCSRFATVTGHAIFHAHRYVVARCKDAVKLRRVTKDDGLIDVVGKVRSMAGIAAAPFRVDRMPVVERIGKSHRVGLLRIGLVPEGKCEPEQRHHDHDGTHRKAHRRLHCMASFRDLVRSARALAKSRRAATTSAAPPAASDAGMSERTIPAATKAKAAPRSRSIGSSAETEPAMKPGTAATVMAIGQLGHAGPLQTWPSKSRDRLAIVTPLATKCAKKPTMPTAAAIAILHRTNARDSMDGRSCIHISAMSAIGTQAIGKSARPRSCPASAS